MATKLTLEIDGVTTTYETNEEDQTFDDILRGFLGCMFGQGYVPGTEMHCFQAYIFGMENIYAKDNSLDNTDE